MAVPSSRLRAGALEIKNRLIKEREEKKRKEESNGKEIISEEEHKKRLQKLKEIGLLNGK